MGCRMNIDLSDFAALRDKDAKKIGKITKSCERLQEI
jgi:hypothetical protein